MMEFDLVRGLSSATSSACLRAVGDERVKRPESTWLLPLASRWSTCTDVFFIKWYQERQWRIDSGALDLNVDHVISRRPSGSGFCVFGNVGTQQGAVWNSRSGPVTLSGPYLTAAHPVNALRDREDEADGEVLSEPAVPEATLVPESTRAESTHRFWDSVVGPCSGTRN
ncbi:unnamed protein product [Arctogadus glacialis]